MMALRAMLLVMAALLASCTGPIVAVVDAFSKKQEPEVRAEALRPHIDLHLPDGDGPFPVAILMAGCLGTQSHHEMWAERLRGAGIATAMVDSFSARGMTDVESLRSVCRGAPPWGFERAGDMISVIPDLARHPDIDGDRILVVGWSHGGWSVMDAMTMDGELNQPTNLTHVPEGWIERVKGVVAFYPHCDFGSRSADLGWARDSEALFLLASDDASVSVEACLRPADRLARTGIPVEIEVFEDADHWFDYEDGQDLIPHRYDTAAVERSWQLMKALAERTLDLNSDRTPAGNPRSWPERIAMSSTAGE